METNSDENVMESDENEDLVKPKKKNASETGMIYLSRIPTMMNVKIVREMFSKYGEVGRIFLQPDGRGRKTNKFSEGWVEFMKKKIAREVALNLNNTQIGGKKRHKWYEELWNIKYLSKFKWSHLNERMAYEKAVHSQRMRTEISQVKRQTTFHIENAEKREKMLKRQKGHKGKEAESTKERTIDIHFKETEAEIVSKRKSNFDRRKSAGGKRQKRVSEDVSKGSLAAGGRSFLSKIFSSGTD